MKSIVIGITGPAGAGKSLAAAALEKLGFDIYSLDASGRALLENPAVKRRLAAVFSKAIIDSSGAVDRKKLAAAVFSDKNSLVRLNAIVHPAMTKRARKWITAVRMRGGRGLVEGALVYELDFVKSLDGVIIIDAPFPARLIRLSESRNWNLSRLRAVDAAQESVSSKVKRGAALVRNTGVVSQIIRKIHAILKKKHWLSEKNR